MKRRCLYCYQPLNGNEGEYHERCSHAFFGTTQPPLLEFNMRQMEELAKEIVIRGIAVTGVQPKISLDIQKDSKDPKKSRFTIVGLWGGYILKPPTERFPFMPENEDLTMHLSELFDIPTAQHALIRLKSGELAYISKRFDRIKKEKLPLEDMCQLTGTLTEDKYRGSMEKVGKAIFDHADEAPFYAQIFFQMALFCYLTGNADMHLKNFSLLTTKKNEVKLAPAYDLLCTKIALPEDKDEMALTINGRKRKLRKADFDVLCRNLKIPVKRIETIYENCSKKIKSVDDWIDISFLQDRMKDQYKQIIHDNAMKLGL